MKRVILFLFGIAVVLNVAAQHNIPPVFGSEYEGKVFHDSRTRSYLTPLRIVWQSDGNLIKNAESLLAKGNNGQSELNNKPFCVMKSSDSERPAILLDFGREIQGGLQIVTSIATGRKVSIRVRFGESVSEAMSEVGDEQGATNDHAMRDFTMQLPWLGVAEIGNSGFRFARIDLLDANTTLSIKEINAIFTYRDIPYIGSFKSNDERLNKIWLTGAYTVHLNMQEYIWDGIKRDRLVWLGDLHPEVMTVSTVFGFNEVIPKSLDLARDITPLPAWMNGMFAYSLWWVIIHRDWYLYQGNLDYLRQQQSYLTQLLDILVNKVDEQGRWDEKDSGFLDWPSSSNPQGVKAGMHALLSMSLQAGSELCSTLGDAERSRRCSEVVKKMKQFIPDHNKSKSAAAMMSLADIMPAQNADNEVIAVDGAKDFSTFYGYYMLQAQAKAGNYQGAIDNIRQFWGGMLDMGATTFWEDFNLEWLENAAGIDELVPAGKKDIHADYGAYCYVKLRHSLCHGWASGPTSWLTEHVLGVKPLDAGCKRLQITPHLGDLEWVEGAFPTPYGVVTISHRKTPDGKIKTTTKAPKEVKVEIRN